MPEIEDDPARELLAAIFTARPMTLRRRRKAETADRRKQRGDNLRQWWVKRAETVVGRVDRRPACRTGLALRNERGRLEWFSHAEIARAQATLAASAA